MNPDMHPIGELTELLDGRLSGDARRVVEDHLRECAICQHELAAQRLAKQAAAGLPEPPVPADLEARLVRLLDQPEAVPSTAPGPGAPVTVTPVRPPSRPAAWRRWAAMAAVAAAVVVVAYRWALAPTDLPSAAAAHVTEYAAQRLVLDSATTEAARLHETLQARVAFPVRVFDLAMMGYAIAGGGVLDLAGHPTAAWIYRSDAGALVCEMFRGRLADLPAPAETREENGITFYIYHRDGGTQVFWEEGDVLCVLASTLPSADVVPLALAKAMKPA